MVLPLVVSDYRFDNNVQRWRNVSTGAFVSQANITAEVHAHMDGSRAVMQELTRMAISEQVSVAEWEVAVAGELADAHRAFGMLGMGGRDNMTQAAWGRVGGNLGDEYHHLRKFSEQLARGEVSEAQAVARVNQYADASQQAYWQAWQTQGDQRKADIDWVIDAAAENCEDCLELEANSPYRARDLPTTPGAGQTVCHGNCRCSLVRP